VGSGWAEPAHEATPHWFLRTAPVALDRRPFDLGLPITEPAMRAYRLSISGLCPADSTALITIFLLALSMVGWEASSLGAQSSVREGGPVVLVAYHSLTGNTEAMAQAAAEGARSVPGADVRLVPMSELTGTDVAGAQGLIVGSPTHWANLPAAVTDFVNAWPYLGDKVAGVFATAGNPGGGSEHVLVSLITALLNHGATVVGPVFEEEGGFRYGWMGAAALTGPVDPGVSEVELDGARRLGHRVAEAVMRREVSPRP
jgi:NAD(P)H dehydrogenase (quinone)